MSQFFHMIEQELRNVDASATIRDVPMRYRRTHEEPDQSRFDAECRASESNRQHHLALLNADKPSD